MTDSPDAAQTAPKRQFPGREAVTSSDIHRCHDGWKETRQGKRLAQSSYPTDVRPLPLYLSHASVASICIPERLLSGNTDIPSALKASIPTTTNTKFLTVDFVVNLSDVVAREEYKSRSLVGHRVHTAIRPSR